MVGLGRVVATAALVVLGADGASAQVRYQPYAPVAPTPYGYPVPYGYLQPDETLGTSPSFVVNPLRLWPSAGRHRHAPLSVSERLERHRLRS